jgi:hypothetical protein
LTWNSNLKASDKTTACPGNRKKAKKKFIYSYSTVVKQLTHSYNFDSLNQVGAGPVKVSFIEFV